MKETLRIFISVLIAFHSISFPFPFPLHPILSQHTLPYLTLPYTIPFHGAYLLMQNAQEKERRKKKNEGKLEKRHPPPQKKKSWKKNL